MSKIIYIGYNSDYEDYNHNGKIIKDLGEFMEYVMGMNKQPIFIKYEDKDCKNPKTFSPSLEDVAQNKIYPYKIGGLDRLMPCTHLINYVV